LACSTLVELLERRVQRHERALELDDLALEPVDPLGRVGPPLAPEDLLLDLGDVLELATHAVQRAGFAVAHGDHEPGPDEDHHLPDLDELIGVDVPRGLQHGEQRVAVLLELRALVGVDRVLECQLVQVEALADRRNRLGARVVDPDPDEAVVGLLDCLDRLVEPQLCPAAVPLAVERAVDDGLVDRAAALVVRGARFLEPARQPRRGRGRTSFRCIGAKPTPDAGSRTRRRRGAPALSPGAGRRSPAR